MIEQGKFFLFVKRTLLEMPQMQLAIESRTT